jgi:hypothetical protein
MVSWKWSYLVLVSAAMAWTAPLASLRAVPLRQTFGLGDGVGLQADYLRRPDLRLHLRPRRQAHSHAEPPVSSLHRASRVQGRCTGQPSNVWEEAEGAAVNDEDR